MMLILLGLVSLLLNDRTIAALPSGERATGLVGGSCRRVGGNWCKVLSFIEN
jgi:hypothetical protein